MMMEENMQSALYNKLPANLDNDIGYIKHIELLCPGVYHVLAKPLNGRICHEHYVVVPEATPDIISKETLSYGISVGEGAYEFEHEVEGSGWELVDFEVERYKAKCGQLKNSKRKLFCSAVYNMGKYPGYFGGHIPPRMTPWGLTIRWKKASEGIFFLETDRCEWILALAHPFWSIDLSNLVSTYGEFCATDLQLGREEAVYRYFRGFDIAPAIFDLLDYEDNQGLMDFIYSREALETYLYIHCPKFVLQYNAAEISGQGKSDVLDQLLRAFGYSSLIDDTEETQERRLANCIHFYPELAGTELLRLPK